MLYTKEYLKEIVFPLGGIGSGSNYVRSMAAFSLLPILSGFAADLPNGKLTFAPKGELPFRSPWFVGTGWGECAIDGKEVSLQLHGGQVKLKALGLPFAKKILSVSIDGKCLADYRFDGNTLIFPETTVTEHITVSHT